jgi:hypothetical protein
MDRGDRPADELPERRPAPGSRDELRPRLARLPSGHPSAAGDDPGAGAGADDARRAEQPERRRPWYSGHAAREQDIERQRRERDPGADTVRWREDWYRQPLADTPAFSGTRLPSACRRSDGALHAGWAGATAGTGCRWTAARRLAGPMRCSAGSAGCRRGSRALIKTRVEGSCRGVAVATPRWRGGDAVREQAAVPGSQGLPGATGLDAAPGVRLTVYAAGRFLAPLP